MSRSTRWLLVAIFALVIVVVPMTSSAKTRYSKGCNTPACEQRVCVKKECRARVARRKARAASATIPAQVSWYGPGLYGNHLACGGTLTPSTAGVAHKTLACGTAIKLCYAGCVITHVIDRGPYVAGREFDLTAPIHQAIGRPGVHSTVRWSVVG